MMPSTVLRKLTLVFGAGALGALVNSVFLWLLGTSGINGALDVAIAPSLTPAWLYPRLVWGGIWGALFILPLFSRSWLRQGLIFSLGPSAVQLLVVFPSQTPHGMFGLGLGQLTPLVVLAVNAAWGLTASFWLRAIARD